MKGLIKGFKLTALLGPFLCIVSATASPQTAEPEKPLSEIERSMEENLNWNLQNALSAYYPETKFVVRADVELQKVYPKRSLPKLPDVLLSKGVRNLPGLPYVPKRKTRQPPPPDRNQVRATGYRVKRIRVSLLLDESLQEGDASFVRRFVGLLANLDPSRGDQVKIERLAFPPKRKPEPPPPAPTKEAKNSTPPAAKRLNLKDLDWRPYAFAAGLALLLLLAFWLGVRRISKQLRKTPAAEKVEGTAEAISPQTFLSRPEKTTGRNNGTRETGPDRNSVIDTIVGTPGTAARIFSRWIEERGERGIEETAIVLASVSESLLDLLAPYFGAETAASVQQAMSELDAEKLETAETLLQQFEHDVRQLVFKRSREQEEQDALAFLNQMTDEQLQHLLKPLKVGVMAIVLAQLRPNRAAKLLDKLEADERKKVLAAMGNIDRIPLDVYQHISRQLAARAGELRKMRYVRANGVDALVKVLDYLDEHEQEEAFDYLQTQDVALAEKVSRRFMTFNQLFSLPETKLRELVVNVDRETLAKSLVSVEPETVEKIITALPEKLGEMVRASLEANTDLPEEQVSEARRALMRSVRSRQTRKSILT